MKIRILCWLLLVAVLAVSLFTLQTWLEQRTIAQKTVRLHVVANSDSEEDQTQKLRVRDAVLREVSALTADCKTADEARALLAGSLGQIEQAAQTVLENSGYDVSVTLQTERFDTRVYGTFSLPAGSYPSLRVRIGAARGKNWWCVVFPSLCTAATADGVENAAQAGGFNAREAELIVGGEEQYRLKFKTLELLKQISDWIFG